MNKGVFALAFVVAPLAVLGQGSPQIVWQQQLDSDRVNTLAYTSDGTELITGSSDRLIFIYNADTGAPVQSLDSSAPDVHASSVENLAINPAGTMLATVCSNDLKLWDLPSGAEHAVRASSDWVVWCDFSPDGKYIATSSFDGSVKIWNTSEGLVKDIDAGFQPRVAVFSPDGQWLAEAGGGGNTAITVRSTSDWSVVATLQGHTSDIYVMRFSPDSTMLASGSYDETCRLWNVSDWSLRKTFTSPEVNGAYGVYGVAFSPDSATLAYSEGENNRIRIVDTASGNITQTYDQNTDNVQCMAFSPTEGYLAYGRADWTVLVANVGVSGSNGGGGGGGGNTGGGGTTSGQGPLTVIVNGNGRVTPNRSTQTLTDGRAYGLAAVADPGNIFVNWTDGNGNVLGQATTLRFTMEDGLVVNANFMANPFIPVAGLYEGLITSSPAAAAGSGRINLRAGPGGGFTAGFWMGGIPRSVTGVFAADGSYSRTFGTLQVTLQLDVTGGSDQVTGTITQNGVTGNVSADRDVWNARSNPAPVGHYTVLLEPNTGNTDAPQGYGYAVVTINVAGVVTVSGALADGRPFGESTYLSKNMTWPFFVDVAGAAEMALGQITVESTGTSDMDGSVSWFRSANARSAYFPDGFSDQVAFAGSVFTAPGRGQTVLTFDDSTNDNAALTIEGADAGDLSFGGFVQANGRFTVDTSSGPPNGFVLALGASGRISGSFIDPATRRRVGYVGVVLQSQNEAAGYFLSGGQSGSVLLTPTP